MSKNGRCIVCGIQGRGKKDFVCEKCLQLAKERGPLFACHSCHKYGLLSKETQDGLQKYTREDLSQKGIIVVTNVCNSCLNLKKKKNVIPEFEIHSVRRHF